MWHDFSKQIKCLFSTFFGVVLLGSCASEKALTLLSDVESEVFLVDGPDNSSRSLGKTPLRVVDPDFPLVVSFRKTGYKSSDLLVFDDSALGKSIEVKLGEAVKESPLELGKANTVYLDQVGRAHRLLLKGQAADARRALDDLEQTSSLTGIAATILRGHIELLEGRIENALRYYHDVNQSASYLNELATKETSSNANKK